MSRKKRPYLFLHILCMLSILGCIGSASMNWQNYESFTALAVAEHEMNADLLSAMEGMDVGDDMLASFMAKELEYTGHAKSQLIMGFLCAAILFGVILMWKRRRWGFYLYSVSNLTYGLLPLVLVGGYASKVEVVGAVAGIVFIAMYALNLKHMR